MASNDQSFQPYAAGKKTYGGGRSAPNVGPSDKLGYAERDNKASGMRNALLRRMKAQQKGKMFSSAAMTPPRNLFAGPGGN